MAPEQEEAQVEEAIVVTRVGSSAYHQYLSGGLALLIGKCENSKGTEFALFVKH